MFVTVSATAEGSLTDTGAYCKHCAWFESSSSFHFACTSCNVCFVIKDIQNFQISLLKSLFEYVYSITDILHHNLCNGFIIISFSRSVNS